MNGQPPAPHLASAAQAARHILSQRCRICLGLRPPLAQARLPACQQLPPLLSRRPESRGALVDRRLLEGGLDAGVRSLVLRQQGCQRPLLLLLAAGTNRVGFEVSRCRACCLVESAVQSNTNISCPC